MISANLQPLGFSKYVPASDAGCEQDKLGAASFLGTEITDYIITYATIKCVICQATADTRMRFSSDRLMICRYYISCEKYLPAGPQSFRIIFGCGVVALALPGCGTLHQYVERSGVPGYQLETKGYLHIK